MTTIEVTDDGKVFAHDATTGFEMVVEDFFQDIPVEELREMVFENRRAKCKLSE